MIFTKYLISGSILSKGGVWNKWMNEEKYWPNIASLLPVISAVETVS